MASPFYWNPHQSKSSRSSNSSSSYVPRPSPKVVSIPVHFVESEQKRSDSALKIQKALRGFLVRKSIQKIMCIRKQVEETEMILSRKQGVELMARDPKERLKVNETLMSLLFKLDSVRGIHSGVRDLRRGVIKKAIALQERVDALPREEDSTTAHSSSAAAMMSNDDGAAAAAAAEDNNNINNNNPPNSNCNDEMSIDHNPQQSQAAADECLEDNEQEDVKEIVEDCNTLNCFQLADEKMVKEEEEEEEEEEGNCEMDDCKEKEEEEEETVEGGGETTKKDEEDGSDMKMMMRMMSELIEKNELQTRMINSLTHRVGQLEKAFMCDRLRSSSKKKKK